MCARRCSVFMGAAISALAISNTVSAEDLPKASTYKVRGTPDLRQGTVQREIDQYGYCGPTAVSNTLMWLGRNGYPRLIPEAANDERAQIALTTTLGSRKYMNTERVGGSNFDAVRKGTALYVLDSGYTVRRVEGRSPQYLETRPSGDEHPLDWLKSVIHDKRTVVWWQLRRLDHDKATDTFSLVGGHWVSVVGYVQDNNTPDVELTLIIHDPANRTMPAGQPIDLLRLKERTEGGKPGVEVAGQFYPFDRIEDEGKKEWAGHYVGVGEKWLPSSLMNVIALELGLPFDRKVLFNGRDLTGWTPVWFSQGATPRIDPDDWPVRRGAIVCDSDSNAMLISGAEYGDFDLTFDVKLPRGGAAEILVRSAFPDDKAMPIPLLDRATLRQPAPRKVPPELAKILGTIAATMRPGAWNTVGIRCERDRVQFTINGKEIVDRRTSQVKELRDVPDSGHIVLVNKDGDAKGTAYRNLRIREL